jgi:hypothetical protein
MLFHRHGDLPVTAQAPNPTYTFRDTRFVQCLKRESIMARKAQISAVISEPIG